ncbi:MAG: hypothetical protein WAO71_04660 [Gallionella sp.]
MAKRILLQLTTIQLIRHLQLLQAALAWYCKSDQSIINSPKADSHQQSALFSPIIAPTFQKQADKIWSESERLAFIDWIAVNALAGDVIPGADGARKVRWGRAGSGKRGGVRVVYFNLTEQGVVVLVLLYAKSEQTNILPNDIDKAV